MSLSCINAALKNVNINIYPSILKSEQGYDDKKYRKHLLYKIDVSGKTIAHLQDILKNSKIRDKEIKFKIGT